MIWTVIILLLLGITLIVVELVVLPGVNLAGIAGGLLFACGIYLSYKTFGTPVGHMLLGGALIALVLAITLALRAGTWRKLSLSTEIDGRVNEPAAELHAGDRGVATTRLAPMGMVDFDGRECEVRTDGQLLAAGTPVEVVRMQDGRAVVQPAVSPSLQENA